MNKIKILSLLIPLVTINYAFAQMSHTQDCISANCKVTYSYNFVFKSKSYNVKTSFLQWEYKKCLEDTRYFQKEMGTYKKDDPDAKKTDFVIDYPCSFFTENIVSQLKTIADSFDGEDKLNFILSFVNSIPYQKEAIENDYWMTPYEILRVWYGDCEDHSFLLSSFFRLLDYDSLLVLFNGKQGYSGHIAVCVNPQTGQNKIILPKTGFESYDSTDPKYSQFYWCESTPNTNDSGCWKVGEKPKFYEHLVLEKTFLIHGRQLQ